LIISRGGEIGIPACRQAGTQDFSNNMWYVYILKSINSGEMYKGLTKDLEDRLKRHFSGRESTTRKMLPLELKHVEICENRIEARKFEKFFKSGFGREILKEIC